MPPVGGDEVNGGIQDGVTFSLDDPNDGQPAATFEFDKDHLTNAFNQPIVAAGNTPILIADNTGPVAIARAIEAAVQNHPDRISLGLTPVTLDGGLVQLGGRVGVNLSITPGSGLSQNSSLPTVVQIPSAGGDVTLGGVRDGAQLTITNGIDSIVFEFDKDGNISPDPSGRVITSVPINETDSAQQVTRALFNALRFRVSSTVINALGIDLTESQILSGGTSIRIAGIPGVQVFTQPGQSNVTVQRSSEPGVDPTLSIQVPETLSMFLPEALRIHVSPVGAQVGGIVDGDTFAVDDDANDALPPVIFEFDNNGVVGTDPNGTQHAPVFFVSGDDADTVALSILEAITKHVSPRFGFPPRSAVWRISISGAQALS